MKVLVEDGDTSLDLTVLEMVPSKPAGVIGHCRT